MTNSLIEQVMKGLRRNRMQAHYVETAAEVPALVEQMIPAGATVACGGSQSLIQSGVMALLQSGKYNYLDRHDPAKTPRQVFLESFAADVYLCSANAVTRKGEVYNVDGNGNRVAALCYGPESVILVVGVNKIVDDVKAAVERVKRIAAPMNTKRLHCDTYCEQHGHCAALHSDDACDGCAADKRVCCDYLLLGQQRFPDRIKVILVGEELGY